MSANNQKLHKFIEAWHIWQHEYHSDSLGNVVFQNQKLLTNIRFTNKSFHVIRNNLKGFENLPDTVMNPDECWSYWKDPHKQTDVYRNYIKGQYVVSTLNGEIQNGYLVDNISKYRKGVIVL
jgi:hypothetical protein